MTSSTSDGGLGGEPEPAVERQQHHDTGAGHDNDNDHCQGSNIYCHCRTWIFFWNRQNQAGITHWLLELKLNEFANIDLKQERFHSNTMILELAICQMNKIK